MLNKLSCHAHFWFSANQITWSRLFIQSQKLTVRQYRTRSVGFFRSQLIWIYTVCKGRAYLGSARLGLIQCMIILQQISSSDHFYLCLALWVKFSADNILKYFFYFSQKTRFDISCKLSPKETICMTFQVLFSGKIRKISPIWHLLK